MAAVASGLAGCAPGIQVGFDSHTDFSLLRTWDWQPRDTPAVQATGEDEQRLEARLAHSIAGGFRSLGYDRTTREPDFRVVYDLSLELRQQMVNVPRAPYLVSSMSSSASYWVEGTDTERREFRELRLVIAVLDADGRVVWKGGVLRRLEASQESDVGHAVEELLERFPRARTAPAPSTEDEQVAMRPI